MKLGSALITAGLFAGALTGCASTLDPRSGENLIRRVVSATPALGTLQSVTCPTGLTPKAGTVFACQLRLRARTRPYSGTFTVHVISSRRVAITGSQDLSASLQPLLQSPPA